MLQALLPPGTRPHERFTVKFDAAPLPAGTGMAHSARGGTFLHAETEGLTVETGNGQDALIDSVSTPKAGALLRDLGLRMTIRTNGRSVPVVTRRSEVVVVDNGPVAISFEVRGTLEAPTFHVGRFTLRATAFAGSSTLKLTFRMIDDLKPSPYRGTVEDAPLDVEDLTLVATTAGGAHATAGVNGSTVASKRCAGGDPRLGRQRHHHERGGAS